MMCDQFSEDYELYALGALEKSEQDALEEHLAGGCEVCKAGVERAMELNEAIARGTQPISPRHQLRERVLASLGQTKQRERKSWFWNWALVAAAALIVALAVGLINERRERLAGEEQLQISNTELARVASVLQVLQSPETKQVTFGPAPATEPRGSLFIHQKLGIIMIAGGLPAAPAGFNYESWVVPKNGAPRPIEPFQLDNGGRAVSVIPGPINLADLKAVAVSLEPSNVTPTKPTKVVFAAVVGS